MMCCPLYIIRCDAPNFILSKSQKKALKKLAAFLKSGKKASEKEDGEEEKIVGSAKLKEPGSQSWETSENSKTLPSPSDGVQAKPRPLEGGVLSQPHPSAEAKGSVKIVRPGTGPDPSKPPARKAKEIRLEKKLLKTQSAIDKTTPTATPTPQPARKPLEAFLDELQPSPNSAHKLTITLVRSHPQSKEFAETYKESYAVYRKYQMNVHKDPPEKCSEKGFKRFLVDSPLCEEPGPKGWTCGYGSYHIHYRIDGALVMVGVVDILPEIVSSKYVYYDTDFDFLRLGVISALNEIGLVRRLHSENPTLRYYCMGYYVHDCQKMRYKGEYFPSFLLCPVTNRYVPYDDCRRKLDETKYVRFYEGVCPDTPTDEDETLVLYRGRALKYGMVRRSRPEREWKEFEEKVKEYTALVGPAVAQSCHLFLS